jgi:Rrf2 family protein
MLELGLHYGEGPVYLKQIARSEDISEKYLSQIIIPLKNAGLVNAFRGAKGGYVLSRSPEKISMYDIVSVLDGDLRLVRCVDQDPCCERASICVTRGLWQELTETIKTKLDAVCLNDLVDECLQKSKQAVHYHI